jgi:hypothetical protein
MFHHRFLSRLGLVCGVVALCLSLGLAGCTNTEVKTAKGDERIEAAVADETVPVPPVRFTDVTAKSGIRFTHTNGAFGKKMLPETMGSGVAFLDFDRDGHQDLLFVNSCNWPGFEDKGPAPTLKLYRNDGKGNFTDVTEAMGLAVTMYGMGVTVGDYDNDGYPDIFVTGVGGNRLFRNEGGKRFVDVTRQSPDLAKLLDWPAGKAGNFLDRKEPLNWSTSAAWLDYDNDGLLDLFVCNYVVWSPDIDLAQKFNLGGGERAYGPPKNFGGSHCFLYRNKGDGTFEDITTPAGIRVTGELGVPAAKALGVVVCDVDDDGWPDIVVANDTVRNFFFHNKRDGTFEEIGQAKGVAYAEGSARGAMGIDWGEYRPGRYALAIGNFANEPTTLLRLDDRRRMFFSDAALIEGIYAITRLLLKFGLFFFDYDLDGRLDLLSVNGHLEPNIQRVHPGETYKQPVQLFWNTGGKRAFARVTAKEAGPDLFTPMVGRGCAYADIDGDGFLDVVLTENGGPARLLRNEGLKGHHWIRLWLEGDGQRTNRSALGAKITLKAGDLVQHREITSARGYLSQSELVATFGLGKATKIDQLEIRWPGRDGGTQVFTAEELANLAVDRMHHIRQPAKK